MPARKQTHYQILGVETNVAAAEIKRAYRRLVKDFHPDIGHAEKTVEDRHQDNERMRRLNEAYETLMDRGKRSAYDDEIGINRSNRIFVNITSVVNEDEARERFLRQIFHPARQTIGRAMSMYGKQMRQLSLDIYDDELVAAFERYVDSYEDALRKGSQTLSRQECPPSLDSALQMMRYSIAQAADGLEEMRRFCLNFDYDHLIMAKNLIAIAQDLSRQALALTKCC